VPLLLGQDVFDQLVGQVGVLLGAPHDPDPAFGLAFDTQLGRLLIQPDAEALQFVFDFVLVCKRLERIQHE